MSPSPARLVQTVTGPVPPDELGPTLAHEHVLIDGWAMSRTYDAILDDEELAERELRLAAGSGVRTIVDCTSVGLGRRPDALARISRATGLRIVMGSGWYREAVHPPIIRESSVADLARILVAELEEGVEGSGIRAGFIGEIGTERHRISAAEERVLRAAALAQRATGVAIWTHTTNGGELGVEQVALLGEAGVPPERIAVSHVGDGVTFGRLAAIAATGAYLSVDNIGYEGGGYPSDDVRADNVARLAAEGHGARVLLSGDTCTRSALTAYGGAGYGRVFETFLPRLRSRGLDEADIDRMIVENPARLLAPTPPADENVGDLRRGSGGRPPSS